MNCLVKDWQILTEEFEEAALSSYAEHNGLKRRATINPNSNKSSFVYLDCQELLWIAKICAQPPRIL